MLNDKTTEHDQINNSFILDNIYLFLMSIRKMPFSLTSEGRSLSNLFNSNEQSQKILKKSLIISNIYLFRFR